MRFRLVRYFTLTSLVFFVLVTVSLGYIYREISIRNLIKHQQSHSEDMANTFANSSWGQFLPFLEFVSDRSLEQLRNYKNDPELTSQIAYLYELTRHLMVGTHVVKVKVYDLQGRTIFSSEKKQIGDDKSTNPGFISARKGVTLSAIDHKNQFSAFENEIEDLDVLFSYIPVVNPETKQVEGVFEIYADITEFLAQIQQTVYTVVGAVVGMLLFLYLVLFFIVRRADRIIADNAQQRERDHQRVVQSEKMASLGQMVAGVAHQLNTPLGSARSNIEMAAEAMEEFRFPIEIGTAAIAHIQNKTKRFALSKEIIEAARNFQDPGFTPQDVAEMLNDTISNVDQMKDLVVNLRDFTRIDRAKVTSYDVNQGLDNVIYIAKSVLPTRIRVEKIYENLPQISCMPSQLNQVFLNLINNAAQAIDEQGIITLTTRVEGTHVRVDVEDTGKGISAEDMPHIFEPYYTTKAAGEGTGLGLSIANDIVTGHGGKIRVQSEPGKGTKFSIVLPISGPGLEEEISAA